MSDTSDPPPAGTGGTGSAAEPGNAGRAESPGKGASMGEKVRYVSYCTMIQLRVLTLANDSLSGAFGTVHGMFYVCPKCHE